MLKLSTIWNKRDVKTVRKEGYRTHHSSRVVFVCNTVSAFCALLYQPAQGLGFAITSTTTVGDEGGRLRERCPAFSSFLAHIFSCRAARPFGCPLFGSV